VYQAEQYLFTPSAPPLSKQYSLTPPRPPIVPLQFPTLDSRGGAVLGDRGAGVYQANSVHLFQPCPPPVHLQIPSLLRGCPPSASLQFPTLGFVVERYWRLWRT